MFPGGASDEGGKYVIMELGKRSLFISISKRRRARLRAWWTCSQSVCEAGADAARAACSVILTRRCLPWRVLIFAARQVQSVHSTRPVWALSSFLRSSTHSPPIARPTATHSVNMATRT